jgi:DNA adenine methylase
MTTTGTTKSARGRVRKCTSAKNRGAIKVHGGKHYLARRHIELFPEQIETYVEACVGGGSVYANIHPELYKHAVLNDLDWGTFCLWSTLSHPKSFAQFHATLKTIPYTEEAFINQRDRPVSGPIDWAVKRYCVSRMSRGGMGKAFAWSDRLRGGRPGDLNAWLTALETDLPELHKRLVGDKPVISCYNVIDLLATSLAKTKQNFWYLDTPYLKSTRTAPTVYSHEMSHEDHERFLDGANAAEAKLLICGYRSPLYDDRLARWRRIEFDLPNHSGQQAVKERRIECVWLNY